MRLSRNILILTFVELFLLLLVQTAAGQTSDSLRFARLQKDMYRHYSTHNTKEFLQTVEQLKVLARKAGQEKLYYKAYGNQAIYTSSYINRGEGVEIAKALYRKAEQEHSRYGLYTANYVLGTIYTNLSMLGEAKSHYRDALNILKEDYPEESRSPLYLAIAKIERAETHYDKMDEYIGYVLSDPNATLQHKLSAMSYRCMSLVDRQAPKSECDKAYAEREQMKQRLGHDDNFGYIIDFDHAILHDDFERGKEIVEKLPDSSPATKMLYRSKLCYAMGDYKQAYNYYAKYKSVFDSLNNDNVRKHTLDVGIMLDKAQAESEAKDLRLANQELEMERIAAELQKRTFQDDAIAMALEMERTRVQEMEAQRANDSLMAYNVDLKMSEYRSQMEARENEERLRRLKWVAAGLLAFVGFIFLAIYTYIRHLQMKRLKEAYDKLEETTAAKERIESELRIARSIQMAMVPHEFPESKRLNIYASMTPAKEVGGDLYDFVVIGDKLYFCLGDVSGKGVPAALFMAMSIRLFRTLCKYQLKPAEIATSMNNELALNNENGMFVTMFIGLLDLTSGRLDFCNAGHNPPVLNGNFINMEPNAPLGLWEGLDYEGETLENIRGKQFFVYSDGLNEAENDAQDQYSDDRLLNFLKGHTDMAAHPLIDLLMEDVEHHVDGAGPSDDMTMLCLRMK